MVGSLKTSLLDQMLDSVVASTSCLAFLTFSALSNMWFLYFLFCMRGKFKFLLDITRLKNSKTLGASVKVRSGALEPKCRVAWVAVWPLSSSSGAQCVWSQAAFLSSCFSHCDHRSLLIPSRV